MRLIDADDFKKFMQVLCKAGSPYESVIELLDKQTTAYDIDKVVEELELHSFEFGTDTLPAHYVRLNEAIEIVKHGGVGTETETIRDKAIKWNNNSSKRVPYEFIDFVEGKREICVTDDVCEWHCDVYGRHHTKCHTLADNAPFEYKYCPYCGKKIKVVE